MDIYSDIYRHRTSPSLKILLVLRTVKEDELHGTVKEDELHGAVPNQFLKPQMSTAFSLPTSTYGTSTKVRQAALDVDRVPMNIRNGKWKETPQALVN